MILLVLLLLFVLVNAVAWRWGTDSRDGRDWAKGPATNHVSTHGRG